MYDKNPEEELVENMSKLLDDITIFTRILLKGKILLSRTTSDPEEIIEKTVRELCIDKACMIHFRLCREGRELVEVKIFILNVKIIGAIAEIAGKKLYGLRVENILKEFRSLGAEYVRVLIYTFTKEILPEKAIEITLSSIIPVPEPIKEKTEKIEQARKKQDSTSLKHKEEPISPREAIGRKLIYMNFPVLNVKVIENPEIIVIDIMLDEECEIEQPIYTALLIAKQYLEIRRPLADKLKIVIHHRKTYTFTFDIKKEKNTIMILGKIPEIIWPYKLRIDKYKYKVKKNKLELSITFKREETYSTVNIAELVKEIYESIKDYWPGDLVIKAKIGTLGLEAKYPL